jgi:hypothetical protein
VAGLSEPSTAEQWRERRAAQLLLAKMKINEPLAKLAEREFAPETAAAIQLALRGRRAEQAAAYRRVVGVPPERRHELRETLEKIAQEGRRQVADLIQELQEPLSAPDSEF